MKLKTNLSCHNITRYCSTRRFMWVMFRGCFLLLNPLCSPTATFLLQSWDLILWIFLLGNFSLFFPSKARHFQAEQCFLDSWRGCRKSPLLCAAAHGKTRGLKSGSSRFGQHRIGLDPQGRASNGIGESSVSQHNRIHFLSEGISFYGLYILSKTSFSCQPCPVKLILSNYSSPDQELQPTIPASLMLASVSRISPFLLEILNQSWACVINPAEAKLWSRIHAAQNFQAVSSNYGSLYKHNEKKV